MEMIYKCPTPIAILLAVYNGEKFLSVQIDSIIAQTNQEWTLYIRDDASTDSTREIIADYCAKYSNIIVIEDELGNLGCYENFRQLLRVIEARYYMFCDADDYWLSDKIQVSYEFILEKEEVYSSIPILVHSDKSVANKELEIIFESDWLSNRINPDWLSKYAYIPLHIVGGATSIFNYKVRMLGIENPPFPVSHDGWVALQTAKYGHIFAIHRSLMLYRIHGLNTTEGDMERKTLLNQIKDWKRHGIALKRHLDFAFVMKNAGYGNVAKYFYYRIVVLIKILWGKIIIRQ